MLGAVPAGAAIRNSSKTVHISPGEAQSIRITCPPGTAPVSAGFESGGFRFTSGGVVPFASVLVEDGSSARGSNVFGPTAGTLTDYAYCDTDQPTIVTRSSTRVQLPPNQQGTVTASCPAGRVPISGGYRFTNGTDGTGAASRSRRVAGGWQVTGFNGGPGQSAFTAFVNCEKNGPHLVGRAATRTLHTFGVGSEVAACPAGTTVVSGGFDGHLSTSPTLRVAITLASRRVQNSWRATAAAGGTPTSTITALVYCEPAS